MPNNAKTVLITRPEHQSANLGAMLSAEGFSPVFYPTIDIQPIELSHSELKKLQRCADYDYLIFVSTNAVIQADNLVKNQWTLTDNTVVAIGPKTAEALKKVGLKPTIVCDKPFNSERLLNQLPDTLKQTTCLIIKGQAGRTLLAEQLRQRGMSVESIDVYKRAQPSAQPRLDIEPPTFITLTSQLALDNLFQMLLPEMAHIKHQSIFVVFSQRIAQHAKNLGCQQIIISHEASDSGLVSAIRQTSTKNSF
jgi:uroporphyrinogen-III synthase